MSGRRPTIFISAAEASGDMHAARLMDALRERLGEVDFVGVGGQAMANAGCRPAVEGLDLTGQASMLLRPLLNLGYYYRAIRRLGKAISEIRPDVHVPVDSPALNWHLATAARKAGAKVAYYIAPQVWAWAPWRVKKLARIADRVACILPFEQQWLAERGVSACYVGHPLMEQLPPRPGEPADILGAWSQGNWKVALLTGSRSAEIRQHAPALAAVAQQIKSRWPAATCTFAAKDAQAAETICKAVGERLGEQADILPGRTDDLLAGSHFAVAVSGTVTLQAAWFGVPMVIVYRTSRLGYHLLGRWLIRAPNLSLVNILAGRRMVPELMPWFGSPRALTEAVLEVMDDVGWLLETRQALTEIADSLRPPHGRSASQNAADVVAGLLDR